MAHRVHVAAVCAALLLACGRGTPPPRDSPLLAPATSDPPGWAFAFAALDRSAWGYRSADYADDALLLDTPDGTVAGATGAGSPDVDLAPDGTIVLCRGTEIQLRDGGSWTVSSTTDVAGVDGYGCSGAVVFSGADVWLLLSNTGAFYDAPTGPDLLCHVVRGLRTCRVLPGRISGGSLARTEAHVWWKVDDELFAIDRADTAEPFVVATIAGRRLQADTSDESVLTWTYGTDEDPLLVALDGTTTRYVSAPESGSYRDVWLGPRGRVLAAELLRGYSGGGICGPNIYGYTTGSGGCATRPWTQLVVWELGRMPATAPVELGHVDLDEDRGEPVGLARGDAVLVASTGALYAVP